ncbi:MAG TPA: hypothetical protein VJ183_19645 [Chloroflexia bacterium]|nr:hypothetical protein [Chloroflexia bacterium]
MAYEPPQKDIENLPEDSEPENRYGPDSTRPDMSGTPGSAGSPKKADPGDYSTLPRSYLNVLTKSRPETYEAEIPNAGWGKTLLGVAIVTLVTFGIKIFQAPFSSDALNRTREYLPTQGLDPNEDPWKTILQVVEVLSHPLFALIVLFTFFAGAGLLYVLARAVRDKESGSGASFMTHAYLLSLSYTPLHTLTTLLNTISLDMVTTCIVAILTLGLTIYQIYNAGVSMQASQGLSAGKAQMVAFIPWVVGIILFICGAVLVLMLLRSMIR